MKPVGDEYKTCWFPYMFIEDELYVADILELEPSGKFERIR